MWLTTNIDNSKELIEKNGNFIAQANHIWTNYGRMYSPAKCKMIETYYCYFYESEALDSSNNNFNSVLNS